MERGFSIFMVTLVILASGSGEETRSKQEYCIKMSCDTLANVGEIFKSNSFIS